jgi:hypothetical protein
MSIGSRKHDENIIRVIMNKPGRREEVILVQVEESRGTGKYITEGGFVFT